MLTNGQKFIFARGEKRKRKIVDHYHQRHPDV